MSTIENSIAGKATKPRLVGNFNRKRTKPSIFSRKDWIVCSASTLVFLIGLIAIQWIPAAYSSFTQAATSLVLLALAPMLFIIMGVLIKLSMRN